MSPPPIGWSFGLCALALLPAAVAQAEPVRLVALNAPEAEAGIAPTASDLECLALNVYWEARSEPRLGQIAVAAVTLNRVADPAFPDTVCAVVRQGEERGRDRCQFSWHCDGLDDRPSNPSAWLNARQIARLALAGRLSDPTGGALWFHAEHVHPDWAGDMALAGQIGAHLFYRPPSALSRWHPTRERPDAAPVAAPPGTSAVSARLLVIDAEPDAPQPDAAEAEPEALAAARQQPCREHPAVTDQPDLMTTLAAASPDDFLARVEELRRATEAGGPPCAPAAAEDGRAGAFAVAVGPGRTSFDAGYGPFPFEATLPGALVIHDAQAPLAAPRPLGRSFNGSFAAPRPLGRSFGAVAGRGGALTRPDVAWAAVVTVATAPSATASAAAPPAPASANVLPTTVSAKAPLPRTAASRAMLASDTPGRERLTLADNVSLAAEPAIEPVPAFAPVQLLRGLAPPALAPRAPASPF